MTRELAFITATGHYLTKAMGFDEWLETEIKVLIRDIYKDLGEATIDREIERLVDELVS